MSQEAEHMSFHHLICSAFLLSFKEIRGSSHLTTRETGLQLDLPRCLISSASPCQLFWLDYALRKHLLHILWHFLSSANTL